jgi:predicted oxidoreductase
MKTLLIGRSPLVSTRLAYGCWRLVGTWDPGEVTPDREAAGRRAVIAAFEAGYTLFDNADIYCRGVCESVFGQALREVRGMRDRVIVATKCGIRFGGDPTPDAPGRYDFSPEHIVRSCEQSLKRLGVETIDLYQLHRPDLLMDPADVADAFDKLRSAGKVRELGVSNFGPSQLRALQSACPMPLAVNQVEIHLGRLDAFTDGTLDQCLTDQITPLAWSPLGGGTLFEKPPHADPGTPKKRVPGLPQAIAQLAREIDAPTTVVALAWLLKHPAKIVPIIGSMDLNRIVELTRADATDLTREQWYRLLIAARGEPMP